MEDKLQMLKTRLGEIQDLNRAAALLGWDQQTYMPPGGAAARAEQPDLVVLDIMLPELDGIQLLTELDGDTEANTKSFREHLQSVSGKPDEQSEGT